MSMRRILEGFRMGSCDSTRNVLYKVLEGIGRVLDVYSMGTGRALQWY